MTSKFMLGSMLLFVMLFLAACQGQAATPRPSPAATQNIPATGPATALPLSSPVPPVDATLTPEMQTLVSAARQKLAEKFQLSAADFILFSVTPATWPDSSLGCPQPGTVYQPVVTPGYQMVFEAGGKSYVVHSDENAVAVICTVRPPGEIYQPP